MKFSRIAIFASYVSLAAFFFLGEHFQGSDLLRVSLFYSLPVLLAFSVACSIELLLSELRIRHILDLSLLVVGSIVFGLYHWNMAVFSAQSERNILAEIQVLATNKASDGINDILYSSDNQRARKVASNLYNIYGLKVYYSDEQMQLQRFSPTEAEENERQEELAKLSENEGMAVTMAQNTKQLRWMANYIVICFGAAFIVSLVALTKTRIITRR